MIVTGRRLLVSEVKESKLSSGLIVLNQDPVASRVIIEHVGEVLGDSIPQGSEALVLKKDLEVSISVDNRSYFLIDVGSVVIRF